MRRSRLVGLTRACAWSALFALTPASAQEAATQVAAAPPPPTITIEGSASAAIVPNTVTLSLAVVTTRPKATDAVAENSKALAAALAAVKAEGVPTEAITTTALDLSAVSDEPKTGAPRIVGYRARNQIELRIKTADDVGQLAATLIDKGINSIDGLRFSSSAEEATRDRLRGEAAKDARHEAEIYTAALGLKLGRVLGIRPDTAPGQLFRVQSGLPVRMASAPVPVEPGQMRVAERVSVTFELVQ